MPIPKKLYPVAIAAVCLSLLSISVSAKKIRRSDAPAFGIEIALDKPFYIPAATTAKKMSAVVRTQPSRGANKSKNISAVKLVPQMEDDKVKVTVFALSGDTTNIKSCSDWEHLKSIKIKTYVARLGEEVSISKLSEYGVKFEKGTLKFRVVPKKALPDVGGLGGGDGGGCGCATCGSLVCCPNPNNCIGCGTCGQACCIP